MEVLPPRLTLRAHLWQQIGLAAALLLALVFAPGCALDACWACKDKDKNTPPPPGHPCQVVTTWLNRVQYTPDVVHDGVPTPGLVGRVYLFGPDVGFPQVGDGGLFVELFDDTHGPADKPLEAWQIDPVALRKFLKKDAVGWGYTLFLPWGSCQPDVTRVHLTCRYDPPAGTPLYAQLTPLAVEYAPPPTGAVLPAAATAAAPPPPQVPQAPAPPPAAPTLSMPQPVR